MTPLPRPAKRSRKTLTRANLEALGAERLAEILLAAADEDANLKHRLRMNLAGEVSAEELAAEIGKRVAALETRRSRVSTRGYRGFVRDLDLQHTMIVGPLAELDPKLALGLLWRFLALAPAMFGLTRDARGQVAEIFQASLASLASLIGKADPDPSDLADRVVGLIDNDPAGRTLELVALIGPSLSAPARAALRTEVGALLVKKKRSERLRLDARILAELDGDVDGFIATLSEAEKTDPAIGASVALQMIAARRFKDAEAALRGSTPPAEREARGRAEWEDAQIALADASGQTELAQELRWAAFERTLRVQPLRDHLRRLSGFDDVEAEARAMDSALGYPRFSDALAFLIAWPSITDAAKLVLARADEIEPGRVELLEAAVVALEVRHPVAASLLLRAMVSDTLRWSRTDRAEAARHQIDHLAALAAGHPDWGTQETHQAFVERVGRHAAHRRAG